MATFSWLDYTVFAAYLLLSAGLGLSFARGEQTMSEYFLAGRNVNRFVVAMTVLAALFSGISFLAGPTEVYLSGIGIIMAVVAFFIATPFTAIFILPHFYRRNSFTAYQFLEERFAPSLRLLASGLFILRVLLWLAAATYAPALALKTVTGLPLWFTIICTGLVSTMYTVFGGMKAVIWTDVMQLLVLFGGMLTIMAVAVGKLPGGLAEVWQTNLQNHRFDLNFSFDPRTRVTFWSAFIGGAFLNLVQMATDQVSVQRYLTAESLREAQRALWIKLWMTLPVLGIFYGAGLVLFAFYHGRTDPALAARLVEHKDVVLPHFVVNELPTGLPGLMIAAIFAASMSTTSAGINSLTSAVLCDFYQTLGRAQPLPEAALMVRARWFTLLFGVLVCALAFAIAGASGNLVESVNTIIGLVGGPLLGLFFLGIFTKTAETRGALAGTLAGFALLLFLFCYRTPAAPGQAPTFVVSFLWFTMIGCLTTMAVGLGVSRLVGRKSPPTGACESHE